MKINGTKKGSASTVGKVSNSGTASKASKAEGSQSEKVEKSGVSVSTTGSIATTFANDASGRADRVESLRLEVSSGDYQPDSQKTAERILRDLTDYSLA